MSSSIEVSICRTRPGCSLRWARLWLVSSTDDDDRLVARGQVRLHARHFDGVRRGVLIAESIWPNSAYADGCGINTLTGADAIAPYGGAAFHDNKVWVRRPTP